MRVRREALREGQYRGITHCPDCQVELDYSKGRQPNSAEPDHIMPVAYGGTDDLDNLRICCRQCNQRRGSKPLGETPRQEAVITTLVAW